MIGSSPRVRGTVGRRPSSLVRIRFIPRVRGTVLQPHPCRCHRRFIPARAGNGHFIQFRHSSSPAHPRACGERPDGDGAWRSLFRFIPARAGNGGLGRGSPSSPSVHPRACGERLTFFAFFQSYTGSSPRVRGTGLHRGLLVHFDRFIPARAGNGAPCLPCACGIPVHPRACGERTGINRGGVGRCGSSPRVRGTGPLPVPAFRRIRFIPARAGTAVAVTISGLEQRFIPARAGNGDGWQAPLIRLPVHPRACGEREVRVCQFAIGPRFIPARAGNGFQ